MSRLGAREALVENVSKTITALAADDGHADPNVAVLKDACRLVTMEEARRRGAGPGGAPPAVDFFTAAGRRMADEMLSGDG